MMKKANYQRSFLLATSLDFGAVFISVSAAVAVVSFRELFKITKTVEELESAFFKNSGHFLT